MSKKSVSIKNIRPFFQPGGTLPDEIESYIPRKADIDLYKSLKNNNFSYVLTARQMGKSSLKIRMIKSLKEEGYKCISIDISIFGKANSPIQWQYSFLHDISNQLNLETEFRNWWNKGDDFTPFYRISLFFESVILKHITDKMIFFLDEIDSIININRDIFNSNDFFALIRSFYNRRAENNNFCNINFVLFGVATPDDLMADYMQTPFNIGTEIRLDYIKPNEAIQFYKGFSHYKDINPKDIVNEILTMTDGQPFLTQKLCFEIVENEESITDIKKIVNHYLDLLFFKCSFEQNIHLLNIQKRVISNREYNVAMLNLYKKIYNDEIIIFDNHNIVQLYLKLTGLVRDDNNKLIIANPIYRRIFNEEWIDTILNIIDRPFSNDLKRWLELNKTPSAALKGELLERALYWANGRNDLTEDEIAFFKYSKKISEEESEVVNLQKIEELNQRIADHYY
jgi:hypothetical protein